MDKLKFSRRTIILIGNYPPDRQESMKKFAGMLYTGFQSKGFDVQIWDPIVFFGAVFNSGRSGPNKWIGYLDKWIVFPFVLNIRILFYKILRKEFRIHICDHSNAPYINFLPKANTSVTCHDVLAIRGALGFKDAYCKSTKTGVILQKWILNSLARLNKIACVSEFTSLQLNQLLREKGQKPKYIKVIHNAFNGNFECMNSYEAKDRIQQLGMDPGIPFILHVGSSLQRKNRELLLNMVKELGSKWKGNICFAGQPLDEPLKKLSGVLGLTNRVLSIVKPDNASLVALYNTCEAFIFPSFSEGFGWPVIEAQACGSPVIASKTYPMPEIGGTAAIYADPLDPVEFANAFITLKNNKTRSELIKSGFNNILRFNEQSMINDYLDLFEVGNTEVNRYAYAS